jgi:hypothetical protein
LLLRILALDFQVKLLQARTKAFLLLKPRICLVLIILQLFLDILLGYGAWGEIVSQGLPVNMWGDYQLYYHLRVREALVK